MNNTKILAGLGFATVLIAGNGLAQARNDADIVVSSAAPAALTGVDSVFNAIVPCRLLDTRLAGGAYGGGTVRSFHSWPEAADLSPQGGSASGCGIPSDATALHVNMTAVGPTGAGYLRSWAWGDSEPGATVFAWDSGFGYSNAANIPVCSSSTMGPGGCDFDFDVKIYGAATNLVVDAYGYYAPPLPEPVSGTEIYYHAVRPCRLADTRLTSALLSGAENPFVATPETVNLAAAGGSDTGCGIPSSAVAIHVNFTVVAPGSAGYMRAWPAGQGEPNATLLAWKAGFGTTNAVSIPICQGAACGHDFATKVYASSPTNLVIDVFGYDGP